MKKILLSAILLIIVYSGLKAQYGGYESTGVMGFGLAYVAPGNDFAQQAFYKPNAGYALPGYALTGTFSYKLWHKRYGIAGLADVAAGMTDVEGVKKSLPSSMHVNEVFSDASSWKNGNLLAGPYVFFQILRRLAVDAKLMGGVNFVSLPDYYFLSENNHRNVLRESFTSVGFGYDFAVGIKYSLTPSTFLMLDVNFMSSKNTKDKIQMMNTYQQMTSVDYSANVGLNMINLGFGWALD